MPFEDLEALHALTGSTLVALKGCIEAADNLVDEHADPELVRLVTDTVAGLRSRTR